jgi:hypothetical protein
LYSFFTPVNLLQYFFYTTMTETNASEQVTTPTRKKSFFTGSLEYHEFIKICNDKNWQNQPYLPRAGAVEARELDAFMRKYSFNRGQVNTKFAHWKQSFEVEKALKTLDHLKLEDAKGLYQMVQGREPWSTEQKRNISYYDKDSCSYETVFSEHFFVGQLTLLRWNLIEVVNNLISNPQWSNENKSKRYKDSELKCILDFVGFCLIGFLEHDLVAPHFDGVLGMFVKVQGRAAIYCLATEFTKAFAISIKRGGKGNETMIGMVQASLSNLDPTTIDLTIDTLLRQTIYNIAGWLVKAVEKAVTRMKTNIKLKVALKKISESAGFVSVDDAKEQNLPTAKVDETVSKVALRYVSATFFSFVLVVEAVCEKVLVERSILIFGSDVVNQLATVIVDFPQVRAVVRKCCYDTDELTNDEVGPVTTFLITIYLKMRSRDYIRQIVSKTRKSLTPGTRSTLAVIAEGGLVAIAKGDTKKEKGQKSDPLCWFCGIKGHLISNCAKTKVRPTGTEPKVFHMEITASGKTKNTFEWNWCTKCEMWRLHTTNQHDDSKMPVDLATTDDNDSESDMDEVEEDCIEMENIVDNL